MSELQRMDETDALVLAGEIRVVIGRLNRRLREQAHSSDLTASQKSVLLHLERDGSATVTALAISPAACSEAIVAPIDCGRTPSALASAPHPTDGRQSVLSLTARCRKMIRTSRAAREDWLHRAITIHLGMKEQATLAKGIALLKRLSEE
jgi:DNA-binding MarR family transcriptional regulator